MTIVGPWDTGRPSGNTDRCFPELVATLAGVFAAGDRVAVRGIDRATHRGEFIGRAPTGRTVTTTWIQLFRIQDGKAVLETKMRHLLKQLS